MKFIVLPILIAWVYFQFTKGKYMEQHKMASLCVSRQLKILRKQANYKLSEFARLVGKSDQQIFRMEKGVNKMDIDTMIMYFKILKIDVALFFNKVMSELEEGINLSHQQIANSQNNYPIEKL